MTANRNLAGQAAILFSIFVAIYFFELASFPLSIDEELAAFRTDASVWIAQGRWGAYWIEVLLLPQPTVPFLPAAFFGVCCIAAYLLTLDAFGKQDLTLAEYASFAVFCGFPTWFFIVEFYSNIAAIGAGMLAAACSVWLTVKSMSGPIVRTRVAAAILVGAFAISIYQSYAAAMFVLGAAVIILRLRNGLDQDYLPGVLRTLLVILVSLLLYAVVDVISKRVAHVESRYVDTFFQPHLLLKEPLKTIKTTLDWLAAVYGVGDRAYLAALWAIPGLIALGMADLFTGIVQRNRWQVLAVAVLSLLAPLSFNLLAGGMMPTRSMVGVPVAAWLFVYVALTSRYSAIRIPSGCLLAVGLFQIMVIQNTFQAANYFGAKHDAFLAGAISERLAAAPGFDPGVTYGLSVFGGLPSGSIYARPPTSTAGYSFFEWDGGNVYRIIKYMQLLGFSNVREPAQAQVDRTFARLQAMPVWPAPGSVQIDGDVALLRLGATPNVHNRLALERLKTNPESSATH